MTLRGWFPLLVACFLPGGSHAQSPSAPPASPDYSSEAFVVESDTTVAAFEADGSGTRENTSRVRIQSEAGVRRFGLLTFSYQESTERLDLDYIRVVHPDGSVVSTPADAIQDMPSDTTRAAPFYSDLREKHVAVRGLGAGDSLEFRIRSTIVHPMIPGHFWLVYQFTRDAIVLREEVRVTVPSDRPVKWKSPGREPAITESGPRRTYVWGGSNSRVETSDEARKEELVYDSARGRLPPFDVQVSSFQSWDEIGRWYGALQRDRVQPTAEIRSKAAELTKDATSEDEKIRAIYHYVSTQYRYIGIAFGIGRYQPHAAGEVLSNRYGDCKDKHTLLASLLESVGIQASAALIDSSRDIDADMPTPAAVNHVITAVARGSELLWLDSTPEVAPFGYLIAVLRDKHALVLPKDGPPALLSTPVGGPSRCTSTFRIEAKLQDDSTLVGKVEQTVQGDDREVVIRSVFRSLPSPQWKDFVQGMSYGAGFAGDVSEVTGGSPEKTDEPFRLAYTYTRKDFPRWSDRSVSAPLPSFGLPDVPEDRKPSRPILLSQPGDFHLESAVEVPKGFIPELPARMELDEPFAKYASSWSYKDGMLRTQRDLVLKVREVPLEQVDAYRKFQKAVSDDRESLVRFSSVDALLDSYQTEIPRLPESKNPAANHAFTEMWEKGKDQGTQSMLAGLKRAVALDAGFARAWMLLGELYAYTRDDEAAVRAYRRVIDAEPTAPVGYRALATTLARLGREEEALTVWRALARVAPESVSAQAGLALLLFDMKRYAEAASALEAVMERSPLPRLELLLGKAYLRSGEEEKAVATFAKAAEHDPRPHMLNEVGYELADANKKLPQALDYARRAVRETEEASQKLSLAKLQKEDVENPDDLGVYWDTLGWVYFRMGDLVRAEAYLDASWSLSQNKFAGSHLAQVREKKGEKEAAVQNYQLALSAPPSSIRAKEFEKETRGRIARLGGKIDASVRATSWRGDLGNLRTFKIPSLTEGDSSADFFLLVGKSGVEDVRFVKGSGALKPAAKVLAKALASNNLGMSFPSEVPARLLRRGLVSCSKTGGCVLVLVTPDQVGSVD